MFPDLSTIGSVTIHTYGLFLALGLCGALLITLKTGRAQGLRASEILDTALVMIVSAIIGSRLMYVIMNYSYFALHPLRILEVWQGGLVYSGGLIAAILTMSWYLKHSKLSFWETGDLWAPGLALGQGIGRIGCFMAGCCYGKPTDAWYGVVFNHPHSLAPLHLPLHPTQLYHSVSNFIILGLLLSLRTKKKFSGQVFLWYLILHSTARLLIERFRGDNRGLIPGTTMTPTQLIALVLLLGAVLTLFILKSREKPRIS
ncbi:MAG: prolipoprotein diacylglyceryl transferase [Deltaproteobacteria bacterium]|nr:prolipoprotein diacylglyceryl transferase [Deltaproteobacteria bacterium]MBW1918634.1 prolipoprotein diacylglyceryl transferase [Deltaproteobacteria bacterium]MBW1933991.1 prolipoprotein diacylglyceryl transferase [Deltaproteobacteria bacterium]MBW1976590.1 prolipoprotein diacylglyceryl transferase [Deltaproteobacteria bacterium]MBW2043262.1 prolipoprotein diacylglyceryl transferase [Deltaproteobacteria bacterium]